MKVPPLSLAGKTTALLLDAAPVIVDLPLPGIEPPLGFIEHLHPLPGVRPFIINRTTIIAPLLALPTSLILLLGLAALETLKEAADGILQFLRPSGARLWRRQSQRKG